MKFVPIYLRSGKYCREDSLRAQVVLSSLGLPVVVHNGSLAPHRFRHSFRVLNGQPTRHLGAVCVPDGARIVERGGASLLVLPGSGPDGTDLRLSAADVAEQASAGGCGLAWATGIPEVWKDIRGAAS